MLRARSKNTTTQLCTTPFIYRLRCSSLISIFSSVYVCPVLRAIGHVSHSTRLRIFSPNPRVRPTRSIIIIYTRRAKRREDDDCLSRATRHRFCFFHLHIQIGRETAGDIIVAASASDDRKRRGFRWRRR